MASHVGDTEIKGDGVEKVGVLVSSIETRSREHRCAVAVAVAVGSGLGALSQYVPSSCCKVMDGCYKAEGREMGGAKGTQRDGRG